MVGGSVEFMMCESFLRLWARRVGGRAQIIDSVSFLDHKGIRDYMEWDQQDVTDPYSQFYRPRNYRSRVSLVQRPGGQDTLRVKIRLA
jgi:hypothetical protein